MAEYVESVEKHLLTVGQGFYGPTSPPEKPIVNLGEWCGTIGSAFIRNSEMRPLTFASVHIVSTNAELDENFGVHFQMGDLSHIEDGDRKLKTPDLFTEFRLSKKNKNSDHSHREAFCKSTFHIMSESARNNGAAGSWRFSVPGMEECSDDFGIIPVERSSIDRLIKEQLYRLMACHGHEWSRRSSKGTC